MRLRFNAPVTFSFAILCTLVLLIDQYFFPGLVGAFFKSPGAQWDPASPAHYFSLLFHVFGHENWTHLWNNFLFILLLGPILEEKYDPRAMLFMILITALVAGLFNILLAQPALVGASSIVFMMIMLVSFARSSPGEIPVSFILIFILYMLAELTSTSFLKGSGVSNLAHIVGGICGVIFGFLKMANSLGAPPSSSGPPPPVK